MAELQICDRRCVWSSGRLNVDKGTTEG